MKKITAVLMALVCFSVLLLPACGKKNETVKVSISADALTDEELADLDAFAEKNGFEKATYNKRKNLVYVTINDLEHEMLLYKVGVSVIRNVYSLIDSDEYPYVKNIERNNDFSEIKVYVDKKALDKSNDGNLVSVFIGNCCLEYLKYTDYKEKNKVCTVTVIDEKTNEVISEDKY